MKNILLVCNSFPNIGGIEKIIMKHACFLNKEFTINLCCLFNEGGLQDTFLREITENRIPVFELNANIRKFDIKALYRLSKLMTSLKIDIVRTYSIYANRYGLLAARLAGIKNVVCSYHSIYPFPVTKKTYLMDSMIYSNCKALIVSSEEMKQHCLTRFKFNPHKVFIVNDGLDLSEIPVYTAQDKADIKKSLNINENDKILIVIGRLEPVKKFDLLIESFLSVLKIYPDTTLLIVGDGSQRQALESLVATCGIIEKVKFLGYQKDVFRFLSISDIFVLTSTYEGMPLVVLEAMAMGLPVVSTDVGNCRDVLALRDYECGIVCPIGDKEKIVEGIIALLTDESKRKQMSISAKKRIEEDFSLKNEMDFYEELFNSFN